MQDPSSIPVQPPSNAGLHIDLSWLRTWHIVLLLALVSCILYTNSAFYQYTFFDDVPLVVINKSILSNVANLSRLFTTDVFMSTSNAEVFYRPILNLVFMLELQISQNGPAIFHITNILLHIGCSILVFVILRQLRYSMVLAAGAALLFCVHPLNTSAVVWIPGRNDLLLTLFVLASFSMLLRAFETHRRLPWILHIFFLFLALLTKETALMLPFVCASYTVWVRRERISSGTKLAIGSGYMLTVILWFALRSTVTQTAEAHLSIVPLAVSWIRNLPAIILYVGKVILPFNLSVMPNLNDESLWLGGISVILFVAAFVSHRPASVRRLCWGIAWFLFFLAPTLVSATIFHEHRVYSAFLGFLIAVAELPIVQSIDFSKAGGILGLVGVVSVYAVLAMMHSEHFRNRTAYAMDAYVSNPGVDASHAAFGDLLLSEGNTVGAERVLTTAIARDSSMRFVHRLLGDVYANRKDYDAAVKEYETAIRIDKFELYAYIGFGKVCIEEGKPDKALMLWKRTVSLSPNFLAGYQYLATFYTYLRNKPDSAHFYVKQVEDRGGTVVPQLLHAIQFNESHSSTALPDRQ